MSSHSVPIQDRRVLLPVYVLDTAQPAPSAPPSAEFVALVDTGATHSMIAVWRQHRWSPAGSRTGEAVALSARTANDTGRSCHDAASHLIAHRTMGR